MKRLILVVLALAAQGAWSAQSTPPTGWSADGSRIIVAGNLSDGKGIYILDSEGRKHEYIPFEHEVLAVKWPNVDGPMCLLARHPDGRYYLWSANSTGIIDRVSERSVYVGRLPSAGLFDCSPDGRYVVFASGTGAEIDLWRADTERTPDKQLTNSGGRDFGPAWSPDGRRIAFSSERGGTAGIWVMPAGGGPAKRLVDGPGQELDPSWSPKGNDLLYLVKGKGEGIYACSASGGSSRPIAVGGRDYAAPVWSHTGKWISFVYGRNPANLFCTPADKAKGYGPYYQTSFDRSAGLKVETRASAWSPSRDQLVFATYETGKMTVRLANISPGYGAVPRDIYMDPGIFGAGKINTGTDR